MTNEDAVLLGKRAYAFAIKKVNSEDAEDLANDVVEHVIAKELDDYVISSLVIDMARKRWGRSDSPNADIRKLIYFGQVGSNTEIDGTPKVFEDKVSENALEVLESWESFERVRKILSPIRRCIVTLYVKYGFKMKEIADCFDKSEGWVSLELDKCGASAERFKVLSRRAPSKRKEPKEKEK